MAIALTKIPNQRIKGKLTPLNLKDVDSIVLHHMAHPTATVKDVEMWHVGGNGWVAIGYNYWIGFDGTVYEGRGLNLSASVTGHNSHIISIGFQGDYETSVSMPDAQYNAGVELIQYLQGKVPSAKKIIGHRDLGGSVCPGRYFPLDEMKKLEKRDEPMTAEQIKQFNGLVEALAALTAEVKALRPMVYNYIDDNMPDWARPTVQKLVDKGYLKGNEKGELELNDTMLKILTVLDRAGMFD